MISMEKMHMINQCILSPYPVIEILWRLGLMEIMEVIVNVGMCDFIPIVVFYG